MTQACLIPRPTFFQKLQAQQVLDPVAKTNSAETSNAVKTRSTGTAISSASHHRDHCRRVGLAAVARSCRATVRCSARRAEVTRTTASTGAINRAGRLDSATGRWAM